MLYRKNYKESVVENNMKRGQIGLFVLIAIAIVIVVLVVLVYPRISGNLTNTVNNPAEYLQSCLEDSVRNNLQMIANRGGYANPAGSLLYQGENIKYLCYTSEYYLPCIVQQPFVKEQLEEEMESLLASEVQGCVNAFVEDSERRGADVSLGNVEFSFVLNPEKIDLLVKAPMTITEDTSRTYNEFAFNYPSNFYDLAILATSIISFEATYGDSEITSYIQYYPNLNIRKIEVEDGNKIYQLENIESQEKFVFASRSLAWPAGYPEENQ